MKKAICLFIVGEKYEKIYSANKIQFHNYAKKCEADIVILHKPLDENFHRPLLSQKLLIPYVLKDYDMALFMDLDILISDIAPSVFDYLPKDKCFGAVLDPRGTDEFNNTWQHIPRILKETNEKYFTDRNFNKNSLLQGSINGGVFLFRPSAVADIFKEYYFSDHNQGELNSYEEAPFAYLSQTNEWFEALPPEFNVQILYKIKGTVEGIKIEKNEKRVLKFFRKYYYKKTNNCFYPTFGYKKFVKKIMEKNYFVHFSGKYPMINNI